MRNVIGNLWGNFRKSPIDQLLALDVVESRGPVRTIAEKHRHVRPIMPGQSADPFQLHGLRQGDTSMRRFVTMSMLVSVVLLACGVCFAQDKQADAAGAKADSPDMWEAVQENVGGGVGGDNHVSRRPG